MKATKTKPTLAELETILASDDKTHEVVTLPSGEIRAVPVAEPEPALPSDGTFPEPPLNNPILNAIDEAAAKEAVVAPAAPTTNPELRYFSKVSVSMPLYVDKVRIQFEVLDQNMGVIKLNPETDARTIEVLAGMAKARIGGVRVIDEAQYIGQKKSHPFKTFAPKSQPQQLRVWDSRPKQVLPSVSANVAAVKSSVAGSSRGPAAPVVGDVVGADKSPATFLPNLQRKSGVLKTPASGQFRADADIPPHLK